MYTPRLGVLGLHKRTLAAVAAVGIVALLALAASMALMQPATVAPKGGTAEGLGLKGIVNIVVKDASGNVKYEKTYENDIQYAGYAALLWRLFNLTTLQGIQSASAVKALNFTYIRLFSDNAATTQIDYESGATRGQLDVKFEPVTPGQSAKETITQAFTVVASGGITIESIELTDNSGTPPTVFSYIDIATISLNQGDSITITWTITVTGS
jgi:hypothetical protein